MSQGTLGYRLRQLFRPFHASGRYYRNYENVIREGPGRLSIYRLLKAWTAPRKRVLDFGCGTGYVTAYLGAQGVDLNRDALAVARRSFPALKLRRAGLAELLKERRRWDAVVAVNVVEHLQDGFRGEFFAALPRLLAPKGRFFVVYDSMYHPLQLLSGLIHPGMLLTDPTHVRCWTQAGFRRELERAFVIERAEGANILSRGLPFTDGSKTAWLYQCRPKGWTR